MLNLKQHNRQSIRKKYLGVNIDEKLCFKAHIAESVNKLRIYCGIILQNPEVLIVYIHLSSVLDVM